MEKGEKGGGTVLTTTTNPPLGFRTYFPTRDADFRRGRVTARRSARSTCFGSGHGAQRGVVGTFGKVWIVASTPAQSSLAQRAEGGGVGA